MTISVFFIRRQGVLSGRTEGMALRGVCYTTEEQERNGSTEFIFYGDVHNGLLLHLELCHGQLLV